MLRTCKNCGCEFSDKHPKHIGRRFGLCGDCDSADKTVKTMGFTASLGKTNYWTEIVKSPSKALASSIRKQGRCGPSHCHTSLGLSSNGSTTAKGSLDSVITNLYNLEGSKAEENGESEIEPLEEKQKKGGDTNG